MRTTNLTSKQIQDLMSEEETFSQEQAHAIETLTGRSLSDVLDHNEGNVSTDTPKGNPFKWSQKEKIAYIGKHGRDGWQELLKSHK